MREKKFKAALDKVNRNRKVPMHQEKRALRIKNSRETILPTKIILPSQSQDIHHEVELGVVIGKGGRHIPIRKNSL